MEPVEISIADARKLALISQQVPTSRFNRGRKGVYQAIEHLGYVQIDTISVVQRAHHLTLWNRVPHYRPRYLDDLVRDR
ncbi:winged helix DNA-binding domain-containing protein, partial [Gammaproteobacteria bacterium]|nr:winged helix DNA-binding domain-containing protein [Gammaproteobacteria bacterium]